MAIFCTYPETMIRFLSTVVYVFHIFLLINTTEDEWVTIRVLKGSYSVAKYIFTTSLNGITAMSVRNKYTTF